MKLVYIPDGLEIVEKPLWFHKRNLMQTATGYGKKLTTSRMLKWNNRLYRIYCSIFSNIGTCYVISKGEEYIVPDSY